MLYVLTIILLILSAIVFCYSADNYYETLATISGVITGICTVLFVLETLIFPFNYIGVDATKDSLNKERESLIYQMENNLYDNDNDLGKKELYDRITEWNTDLAYNKRIQNDFWVGIFYPDIYDEIDFIELGKRE